MEPTSPLSSGPAPDEDEPVFAREPLVAGRRTYGTPPTPRINALTLVLAALLVLVIGLAGFQHLRQQTRVSGSAPLPGTLTLALTPAPTISPGQKWITAGPSWAQQIVFAPSQPETAYVCGTADSRDPTLQSTLVLGISGDSGHTWQTHTTHLAAGTCQITVDPIDAQDLLLAVERCFACSTPSHAQLYRSFDGGLSWRLVQFPALGNAGLPPFTAFWWAWQGAAVFIRPVLSGPTNGNLLAVSVADSPFTWVNERALLAQVPASMQLNSIYATARAVYVEFGGCGPSDCGDSCLVIKRSSDRGTAWTIFHPYYDGQHVYLLDQFVSIADGQTLLGHLNLGQSESAHRYLRSNDGGATWKPLPPLPGDLLILTLASTPTGITYVETWSFGIASATPAVYRLAPGSGSWVLVGALPESGFPLIISWDTKGHPLALWSSLGSSGMTTGIAIHTP